MPLHPGISRRLSDLVFESLKSRVATLQQQITASYQQELAAAVAAARAKLPAHRAVSDEDLRRQERDRVRRAWLQTVSREYDETKAAIGHAHELLEQNIRAARIPATPAPAANASGQERIEHGLALVGLRLEFPRGTPLAELWQAFEAAEASGDAFRAAHLELEVQYALDHPAVTSPATALDAARMKRERDAIRATLEARRDARLTENDKSNLAAWTRELAALDAAVSAAHQALIAHGRNVA